MTIPTTPTGGEPTAGANMHVSAFAYADEMQALLTGVRAKAYCVSDFIAGWKAASASAPTLAARVAELEGMLAVVREALRPFGSLYDRALKITGESFAGRVNTCIVNGWLNRAHFALATQAIAQLDKEAGGK